MREHLRFLASFLRRPLTVGAVAPSSARLARTVIGQCNLRDAGVVVELGAGTGAITEQILAHIGPRTRFVAFELDAGHAARLARRFPRVTVCNESAENLQAVLARLGCDGADCVVSGLPWGSMGRSLQERIMAQVLAALKPSGHFCGFGYVHAKWYSSTQAFHRRLRESFADVRISPVVWRNVPPAFAFSCPLSAREEAVAKN